MSEEQMTPALEIEIESRIAWIAEVDMHKYAEPKESEINLNDLLWAIARTSYVQGYLDAIKDGPRAGEWMERFGYTREGRKL